MKSSCLPLYTKLSFALLFFSLTAVAQVSNLFVTNMPNLGKLPVNEVTAIQQDEDGYMWYGTSDGLCRDDGYSIRVFRSDFNTPGVLTRNFINNIAVDNNGHIWFSTRKGIYILDKRTFKAQLLDVDDLGLSPYALIVHTQDDHIWIGGLNTAYEFDSNCQVVKRHEIKTGVAMFYEDSQGNFFMAVYDDGLYCKPAGTKNFHMVAPDFVPTCMTEDHHSGGYIVCQDGLFEMKPERKLPPRAPMAPRFTLTRMLLPKDESGQDVHLYTRIVQDDHTHYTWLVSYYYGLVVLDASGHQIELPSLLRQHNTNAMNCLYKDHMGRIWMSGFNTGCQVISWNVAGISEIDMKAFQQKAVPVPAVLQLYKDTDDIYWIYQDRKGMYLYNPATSEVSYYYDNPALRALQLYQIKCTAPSRLKNAIWTAFYGNRIICLQRQGMTLNAKYSIDLNNYTDGSGEVECLNEDENGILWVGAERGLYQFNINNGVVRRIPKIDGQVAAISFTENHQVWLAMKDGELIRYDKTKLDRMPTAFGINSIADAGSGHLWVATSDGRIMNYDIQKHTFEDFTTNCGLEGSVVNDIIVDNNHNLWVISNQQIRIYNPLTNALHSISSADENVHLQRFLPHSFHYDQTHHTIYFGGIPGIMAVNTSVMAGERLHDDTSVSQQSTQVYITDIRSANNSIWFDSLRHQDKFILHPDDRNIEISFSNLNILNSATARYAYRLLGMNDEWIYLVPGKNEAIYSNLPKGNYTFQVKTIDENGIWDEHYTELSIYRQPAWYETILAYFCYVLLVLALIFYAAYRYQQRVKLKNEKHIAEQLVQTKLSYFTNISHELLTPLAVISSINESLEPTDAAQEEKRMMIHSNITRLKHLLQQILDFRKVETGNLKLYVEQGNLSQLIDQRCKESFIPLAQTKQIQINIEKPFEDIIGYFDIDKIDKVLFNLVSNAIKYSNTNTKVTIRLQLLNSQTVSISVVDEGFGIDSRDLQKIFSPFYISQPTTRGRGTGLTSNGIGLSLTKDLIELHHGTIQVQSQRGRGSTFTIQFPIHRDAYSPIEIKDRKQDEQVGLLRREITQMHINRHPATDLSLLIVEDNVDMLTALDELLSKQYHTFTASNGREALEVVRQHPELQFVVSDISMPDMDGLTLCRELKGNIDTSHIIVVMLTAMISSDNQVASYDAGADAYLPKPFESKVLNALLTNLWNQRQSRQQAFRKNPDTLSAEGLEVSDIDREFIDRAITIVQQNISSPQLDVEFLASQLCMSRSTLTRKLRSVTGDTPLDFIKSVKLKHAYRLLQQHRYSVIEVIEAVGYNDRHTFSQSFKDMFGVTPSKV